MPGGRILIVEDENIVAMDIQGRLRGLGYDVSGIAPSGEEAVQEAEKAHPDLVLMDIRLKGDMDGIQAAEKIRARLNIPVVYVTAYADEATLQRAKVTEPFGYVLKPFETRELLTSIEMALYKHKGEQELRGKNQQLEQKVKELSALNAMFQQHLDMQFETEERYRQLHSTVRGFLSRLGELTGELERASHEAPPPSPPVTGHLARVKPR